LTAVVNNVASLLCKLTAQHIIAYDIAGIVVPVYTALLVPENEGN